MKPTHVVFGAAGGLGSAIVRNLLARGQSVRAVVRSAERASQVLPEDIPLEVADATDAKSAHKACRDAAVIYHCISVPFDHWDTVLPKINENIAAGTRYSGARLVFPSNVYGYGPLQKVPADENHPPAATCKRGQLRNQMEAGLLEEDRAGQIRVVIPRFSHLYGPNVTSPLTLPIFRAALSGMAASWPGRSDVPHDLAYIDDAAAACVLLATIQDAHGQVWHVPGPGPLTGRQFIEMVYAAAGTEPSIEPVQQDALKYSGMATSETDERMEVMYLFEQPLVLDGGKFAGTFPSFRYTPHEQAIARTIEWLQQHSTA